MERICRFACDKTEETSQCVETKREEAERKAVTIAATQGRKLVVFV